ncbi:MAG TPA: hypothetical protein VKE98_13600 [Gemmataceae bacterium]|nr:hypothetical protein [Gemmataceae bacterium]
MMEFTGTSAVVVGFQPDPVSTSKNSMRRIRPEWLSKAEKIAGPCGIKAKKPERGLGEAAVQHSNCAPVPFPNSKNYKIEQAGLRNFPAHGDAQSHGNGDSKLSPFWKQGKSEELAS